MCAWKGDNYDNFSVSLFDQFLFPGLCLASSGQDIEDAEDQITKGLKDCQGSIVDIGGYYKTNRTLTEASMRPSKKFNELM